MRMLVITDSSQPYQSTTLIPVYLFFRRRKPKERLGPSFGFSSASVSRLPTSRSALYLFKMASLWYFLNCFVASLPATPLKTAYSKNVLVED